MFGHIIHMKQMVKHMGVKIWMVDMSTRLSPLVYFLVNPPHLPLGI